MKQETIYKIYKTTENSLSYNKKEKWNDDIALTIDTYNEWEPFQSDQYWVSQYPEKSLYWSANYWPIAPSGKPSFRYGGLNFKALKNLEEVGTFDGQKISIEIPYKWTSIYELQPLDVFEFTNEVQNNLNYDSKYVLEEFDTFNPYLIKFTKLDEYDNVLNLSMDCSVKKVGKIKIVRVYEA